MWRSLKNYRGLHEGMSLIFMTNEFDAKASQTRLIHSSQLYPIHSINLIYILRQKKVWWHITFTAEPPSFTLSLLKDMYRTNSVFSNIHQVHAQKMSQKVGNERKRVGCCLLEQSTFFQYKTCNNCRYFSKIYLLPRLIVNRIRHLSQRTESTIFLSHLWSLIIQYLNFEKYVWS